MRFNDPKPGIAELLPGIVFGRYRDRFNNVTTLPFGQMPRAVRDQNARLNAQFKYMPTTTLDGPQARMAFGDYSVAVSFLKPYAGWAKIKPLILDCMNAALESNLTGGPERYGLKYVNILKEGRSIFDLEQTRVRIELGGFQQRPNGGTAVHAEIELNGCIATVDVATGGKASIPGLGDEEGVAMVIDVGCNASRPTDPRNELPGVLETLHETEKTVFFGLLTESALQKLGPRYPATH
jgi:uncharacterized protein (TIGR04255 family)